MGRAHGERGNPPSGVPPSGGPRAGSKGAAPLGSAETQACSERFSACPGVSDGAALIGSAERGTAQSSSAATGFGRAFGRGHSALQGRGGRTAWAPSQVLGCQRARAVQPEGPPGRRSQGPGRGYRRPRATPSCAAGSPPCAASACKASDHLNAAGGYVVPAEGMQGALQRRDALSQVEDQHLVVVVADHLVPPGLCPGSRPVLGAQSRHAVELTQVVGHQGQAERDRLGGDQHVHGTDGRTARLEVRPQAAVGTRG